MSNEWMNQRNFDARITLTINGANVKRLIRLTWAIRILLRTHLMMHTHALHCIAPLLFPHRKIQSKSSKSNNTKRNNKLLFLWHPAVHEAEHFRVVTKRLQTNMSSDSKTWKNGQRERERERAIEQIIMAYEMQGKPKCLETSLICAVFPFSRKDFCHLTLLFSLGAHFPEALFCGLICILASLQSWFTDVTLCQLCWQQNRNEI